MRAEEGGKASTGPLPAYHSGLALPPSDLQPGRVPEPMATSAKRDQARTCTGALVDKGYPWPGPHPGMGPGRRSVGPGPLQVIPILTFKDPKKQVTWLVTEKIPGLPGGWGLRPEGHFQVSLARWLVLAALLPVQWHHPWERGQGSGYFRPSASTQGLGSSVGIHRWDRARGAAETSGGWERPRDFQAWVPQHSVSRGVLPPPV